MGLEKWVNKYISGLECQVQKWTNKNIVLWYSKRRRGNTTEKIGNISTYTCKKRWIWHKSYPLHKQKWITDLHAIQTHRNARWYHQRKSKGFSNDVSDETSNTKFIKEVINRTSLKLIFFPFQRTILRMKNRPLTWRKYWQKIPHIP